MNFLKFVLNITAAYLDVDFLSAWFFPLLAFAFLATVPAIIHSLISWR